MHEKQEPEISNDVTQKAGGQVTDNPQLDDGTNDNVGFIEWYRRQRDNLGENRNDSNDGLGVVRTGGLVIGFVDAVNGPGARPCPEFVPTRHEVLEIARYWGSELLDNQIYWFLYGQTGSDEIRIMAFAEARLDRIAAILGTESVTAVWEQVEHKFREQLGDKLWDTFRTATRMNGTRFAMMLTRPWRPVVRHRQFRRGCCLRMWEPTTAALRLGGSSRRTARLHG